MSLDGGRPGLQRQRPVTHITLMCPNVGSQTPITASARRALAGGHWLVVSCGGANWPKEEEPPRNASNS